MKPSEFVDDPTFLDPARPPFLEERDGQCVAHLFSFADVKRVLVNTDRDFSQDSRAWLPPGEHHMMWYFMWATDPGKDGRHDTLRGLVEDWFHHRAVATMRERIRGYARDLRRAIIDGGSAEFDLARDFAYRLSMRTICGLVGIPLEREEWLRHEAEIVVQAPDLTRAEIRHNVESFFWELVAKRLARPQDELLDRIIAGWRDGLVADRELLGFIWGFISAGTDTTGTAIVNAFALASEFGQLDYLRDHLDDDDVLRKAVDEALRFATPFPAVPVNFAVRPVTFGSLEIPASAQVILHLSAANRDPEINGANSDARDPGEFDLTRSPNHHLTFGLGAHHCLGASLARLETLTALRELLTYLPGLRHDESKPFKRYAGAVHGVAFAPFVFDQPNAAELENDYSLRAF